VIATKIEIPEDAAMISFKIASERKAFAGLGFPEE
jgi:hypothetical protein